MKKKRARPVVNEHSQYPPREERAAEEAEAAERAANMGRYTPADYVKRAVYLTGLRRNPTDLPEVGAFRGKLDKLF